MNSLPKVSICIPQYNRIHYLLRSLEMISHQTYPNIEIAISDDGSTDETESEIQKLARHYRYPIIFQRSPVNLGYDRNYRRCIEIATGDYAFVIGNDDSIYGNDGIEQLVDFLSRNEMPDVGFCNMIEERTGNTLIRRAMTTGVIGSGSEVALKYYSCFSFVGGLIYKRSTFLKFNTDKHDGSIYSQIYLGVYMVASGAKLFSMERPLVLKDILLDGVFRKGYRDRIAKKWRDYRVVDGGIPSVINVLIAAIDDAKAKTRNNLLYIFKRIYGITYPHWILDYKENGAWPEAVGLMVGLNPSRNINYKRQLDFFSKIQIYSLYLVASILAFITPVFLFTTFKQRIYSFFKR